MGHPYVLFGCAGLASGVISLLIFLVKQARYSEAMKVKGQVSGGQWIIVSPGLPSEQRVWKATISYADQKGMQRSFNPTFGLSPSQGGSEVDILLFPDGTAMLNGFREKWIWVIVFATPAVCFGWMLLAVK
jgi:hypothetical protein